MQWYIANSKPRQESLAKLSIERLGVETFFPKIKENRMVRRKKRTVIGPLFPGYFFVRLNINTHYKAVHFAHGVRGLVTFGAVPAAVEAEIIRSIKSRTTDGYLVFQPPCFEVGQTVRIQAGPFEGLEAIFEREMSGQQRVVVLLKMISYQARVVVGRECVAVAS